MMTTGFAALDKLTGGFTERKGYLLYGDAREAATAFALSFLASGADSERPVALVTERSAQALVEEALRYGFDLSSRLESGALLLFEYPANISASTRNLSDESRIIKEFQHLVGKHGIDRLVLDPVTPLLIAPSQEVAANRFQKMASSFSGLGATTIYVLNGPGAAEYVPACREAAEGILRLEAAGSGTGKIVFERWGRDSSAQELEFGVVAGIGLVPVSRERGQSFVGRQVERPHSQFQGDRRMISIPQFASSQLGSSLGSGLATSLGSGLGTAGSVSLLGDYDKPRTLLIHPDGAQRSALAAILRKHYAVDEALGAIDGLASLSNSSPDVLVLAQEMRGVSGAAIVHKLRQSGHNLPIIMVGSRIRRLADQASLLQAGVDACLEYPINGQLLHLHIDNLLRRIGRLKDPLNRELDAPRRTQRLGVNCTTDLDLFCDRAGEEVTSSLDQGLPVPLFVMYYASGKPQLEELSSAVLMVTRSTDLVYVGTRGIAVLLPEARAVEPFLARFSKSWSAGSPPVIEQPRVAGQPDLREYLVDFVGELTGTGFSVTQIANAQMANERVRPKPFGTASNGAKG